MNRILRAPVIHNYARACLKLLYQAEVSQVIAHRRTYRDRKPPSKAQSYAVVDPTMEEVFEFDDPELTSCGRDESQRESQRESQSESQSESQRELLPDEKPQDHTAHHETKQRATIKPKRNKTSVVKVEEIPQDQKSKIEALNCDGCGASLQCWDEHLPGYIPKKTGVGKVTKAFTCLRCHTMTYNQQSLDVAVSKEEYRDIVARIKNEYALILLVVDLLDIPDSIIPDIFDLVGEKKKVVVLGNKVDMIPGDAVHYLARIRRQLMFYCHCKGIPADDPADFHLVSAKTGFGIETLISRLQSRWAYKGDVYLVGMANSGKSSIFNRLLDSDFCKTRASEVYMRATMSPWPGTTLNLLKFPMLNPTSVRMDKRAERLRFQDSEAGQRHGVLKEDGYIIGNVGRTFKLESDQIPSEEVEFDLEVLRMGGNAMEPRKKKSKPEKLEMPYNEIKDACWLYDTPGIFRENDILSILTEKEVKRIVPTEATIPRKFNMTPGSTMFLGGFARIDYVTGRGICSTTVLISYKVPVKVLGTPRAEEYYAKKRKHGVPCGGQERLDSFPPLVSQEFQIKGCGFTSAAADITLSSAGWIAVMAGEHNEMVFHISTPESVAVSLRSPPLLPYINKIKIFEEKKPEPEIKKPQRKSKVEEMRENWKRVLPYKNLMKSNE